MKLRRIFGRLLLLGLALFALFVAFVVVDAWTAFGGGASGERLARMQRSPRWNDGKFHNPEPLWNDFWGSLTGAFDISEHVSPSTPLEMVPVDPKSFDVAPATGLRVTWLGHSTTIVELDGLRVLTDPIWGHRASPLDWIGPERWFSPPLALEELPKLDAVVISHDHYDHMDHRTLIALRDRDTKFVVPLGSGAHLEAWGIAPAKIVELDWWETTKLGALEIACVPARHAAGRIGIDQDEKLWAGWALLGPKSRVYYSGDTGLFPAMREIGARFGPFDLTMIEAGQYGSAWPDWHLGPEQAVVAHQLVRGRVMLPVHWGTFALAYHAWTEPIERVLAEATRRGVDVFVPRPGQSFEPAARPALERWWPNVPWKTATEAPIVSTKVEGLTSEPTRGAAE
ncbi:MBL fold metallo-hydrolase [Myxococcota bacterium]|nr:MBL fold metallo-hydrolase [Myxococcota bacterium]